MQVESGFGGHCPAKGCFLQVPGEDVGNRVDEAVDGSLRQGKGEASLPFGRKGIGDFALCCQHYPLAGAENGLADRYILAGNRSGECDPPLGEKGLAGAAGKCQFASPGRKAAVESVLAGIAPVQAGVEQTIRKCDPSAAGQEIRSRCQTCALDLQLESAPLLRGERIEGNLAAQFTPQRCGADPSLSARFGEDEADCRRAQRSSLPGCTTRAKLCRAFQPTHAGFGGVTAVQLAGKSLQRDLPLQDVGTNDFNREGIAGRPCPGFLYREPGGKAGYSD